MIPLLLSVCGRICGVHVVSVVIEDFGSAEMASELMTLDNLRHFFAFLGSTDTAVLIIRTRSDLDRLEAENAKGSTGSALRCVRDPLAPSDGPLCRTGG